MQNNNILIENKDDNLFVSDLLNDIAKLTVETYSSEVKKQKKQMEGTKGVILTSILLGIAGNAAYDLIKTVLRMQKGREDYKPELKIHFEGNEYTLDYISKTDYKEISIKKK